jgi:hypothetical protein
MNVPRFPLVFVGMLAAIAVVLLLTGRLGDDPEPTPTPLPITPTAAPTPTAGPTAPPDTVTPEPTASPETATATPTFVPCGNGFYARTPADCTPTPITPTAPIPTGTAIPSCQATATDYDTTVPAGFDVPAGHLLVVSFFRPGEPEQVTVLTAGTWRNADGFTLGTTYDYPGCPLDRVEGEARDHAQRRGGAYLGVDQAFARGPDRGNRSVSAREVASWCVGPCDAHEFEELVENDYTIVHMTTGVAVTLRVPEGVSVDGWGQTVPSLGTGCDTDLDMIGPGEWTGCEATLRRIGWSG